jgi:hypothetical protein
MQTSGNFENIHSLQGKERPEVKYAPHIARLAAFIQRHQPLNDTDHDGKNIVEIRRSDADIAFHLGISMAALEQCFVGLIEQKIIRLRGANQIEILNGLRLSEIAKQKPANLSAFSRPF